MLASKERHGCFQHVHTSDYLLRILTQLNYLLHSFWSLTEFSRITKRVPVLLTWKTITNRIKTISNLNKAVINDFLNWNIISLINYIMVISLHFHFFNTLHAVPPPELTKYSKKQKNTPNNIPCLIVLIILNEVYFHKKMLPFWSVAQMNSLEGVQYRHLAGLCVDCNNSGLWSALESKGRTI